MPSPINGPLSGSERIAILDQAQRPLRMGSADELAVADADRVRAALSSNDRESAQRYLEYLHPGYLFIIAGSAEWATRFPAHVAASVSESSARELARRVHQTILEGMPPSDRDCLSLLSLLEPSQTMPPASEHAVRDLQAAMTGTPPAESRIVGGFLANPLRTFERVIAAIAKKEFEAARLAFEEYFAGCRTRHDLLIDYTWAFASAIEQTLGQQRAERALEETFHGCSFIGPMRQLVPVLKPEELVTLLAEHLRHHFSGPARSGSVQIIEEEDRYRLVFNVCGSGGAARRRAALSSRSGFRVLPLASTSTWGRAGEVPAYCAHCAINEIAQVEEHGFPSWVTEFDPNPNKPCGWTVYKNPTSIPDRYFARIGKEKPRS